MAIPGRSSIWTGVRWAGSFYSLELNRAQVRTLLALFLDAGGIKEITLEIFRNTINLFNLFLDNHPCYRTTALFS